MKKKSATWIKSDAGNDIAMNRAARRQVKKQTGETPRPILMPFKRNQETK